MLNRSTRVIDLLWLCLPSSKISKLVIYFIVMSVCMPNLSYKFHSNLVNTSMYVVHVLESILFMFQMRSRFSRYNGHRSRSSALTKTPGGSGGGGEMSLDSIVTEYLRKQHALCRNPVSMCPPMSLFQ